MENGFVILDYEENLSDYLKSYDTNTFDDLYLENTSWKCKIKKLNEGKLFEILCKYEKIAFEYKIQDFFSHYTLYTNKSFENVFLKNVFH